MLIYFILPSLWECKIISEQILSDSTIMWRRIQYVQKFWEWRTISKSPIYISSVQFSHLVVSDSLQPHGLQHARLPCPSPTPGAYLNSCPSTRWCHPIFSSSVVLFSSCLQYFPASGSFQMSQFFASGSQSFGVSASASVLPMNIQDWFPLGLTGLISLQSKGLSRIFSNTTAWKHQFFGAQPSLGSNSHICTWLLEKPQLWLWGDFSL